MYTCQSCCKEKTPSDMSIKNNKISSFCKSCVNLKAREKHAIKNNNRTCLLCNQIKSKTLFPKFNNKCNDCLSKIKSTPKQCKTCNKLHNQRGFYCQGCINLKNRESRKQNSPMHDCICNLCKCTFRSKIQDNKNCCECSKKVRKYGFKKRNPISNWSKKSPIKRCKYSVASYIYRDIKGVSINDIFTYLNYTPEDLVQHLEDNFEPWMTWDNWGQYDAWSWNDNDQTTWRWHIDHIIGRSMFNITSLSAPNFISCWQLSNLIPKPAKYNLAEANKWQKLKKTLKQLGADSLLELH